jgi:hypothetical protein
MGLSGAANSGQGGAAARVEQAARLLSDAARVGLCREIGSHDAWHLTALRFVGLPQWRQKRDAGRVAQRASGPFHPKRGCAALDPLVS